MKKLIVSLTALLICLLFAGCNKAEQSEPQPYIEVLEVYDTPIDLNITHMRLKASVINSYQFNYSDTDVPEKKDYYYFVKGLKQSVVLPEKLLHYGNVPYDMVFMDKTEETAYAWCSNRYCKETDRQAEEVSFSDFDIMDPREMAYEIMDGKITKKEQWKNQIVYVVDFHTYSHENGTALIQSYYMLPLRVEFSDGRVIEYKQMYWDIVRDYYVDFAPVVKKVKKADVVSG